MPRDLEKTREDKFVEYAESKGCLCFKLRIDGINGFPDRSVFLPDGRVFFIEFKRPGGKVRPGQAEMKRQLEKRHFRVYVFDSFEDAKRMLDNWIKVGTPKEPLG